MASKSLYDEISAQTAELITKKYSTSFSLGIRFLNKNLREAIYNIYGFVRIADEIVDSFHDFEKDVLLYEFKKETYKALEKKISVNPVLNSFQKTVHQYSIDRSLIEAFLQSMEMDLDKKNHDRASYENYIYGSAEAVGLMCLRVFTEGDEERYQKLHEPAMRLGAAFQKINFLRDLNEDVQALDRVYFPGVDFEHFNDTSKLAIETEIEADFDAGYLGILKLPKTSRFGVYLAYIYYRALFNKIKNTKSERVAVERIRIPAFSKMLLLCNSYLRHNLNML